MDDKSDTRKLPPIDKTLNVVFQRKNYTLPTKRLPKKEASVYTERIRLDPRCSEIVKDITKQTLRKKIEVMQAEFERADDKRNLQFSELVSAVERANAHEIKADTFLDKVESTMKSFNIDIDKYQRMYEKIMEELPTHAVNTKPT